MLIISTMQVAKKRNIHIESCIERLSSAFSEMINLVIEFYKGLLSSRALSGSFCRIAMVLWPPELKV